MRFGAIFCVTSCKYPAEFQEFDLTSNQNNYGSRVFSQNRVLHSRQAALTYQIPAPVYFIFLISPGLCCFSSGKAILDNKPFISLYCKCQLIGWTVASLYWTVQGWTGGEFRGDLALVQLVSDVLLYILITHIYRIFALKSRWQDLSLNHLFGRMLVAIPVMGIFYTALKVRRSGIDLSAS